MKNNKILVTMGWMGCAAALPLAAFGQVTTQQPNVIIIEADDLGFGDLSCYGAWLRSRNRPCTCP